jgi:hypothetical protein
MRNAEHQRSEVSDSTISAKDQAMLIRKLLASFKGAGRALVFLEKERRSSRQAEQHRFAWIGAHHDATRRSTLHSD